MIVTTILASIGTPSAPGAGVIVLGSVLELSDSVTAIALIIGVDRLLGMFSYFCQCKWEILLPVKVFNRFYKEENSDRLEGLLNCLILVIVFLKSCITIFESKFTQTVLQRSR